MYRLSLISLSAIAIATLMAGNVNAQDVSPKKITVGPAIEFGSGTAFGLQGKIPVLQNFSVRPIVLFGYQPVGNTTLTNTLNGVIVRGSTRQVVPSGTAYGLAATYDFTFPSSKISGYVGPRILFSSTSASLEDVKSNSDLTNIGLITGIDYAISDKFTAGLTAIYEFSSGSRSLSGSDLAPNGSNPNGTKSVTGTGFSLGINLGYNF